MRPNRLSRTRHDGEIIGGRLSYVAEPDVPECDPTERWKVSLLHIQMTDRHDICVHFAKRDGTRSTIRVDAANRSDFGKFCRELDSHNARTPHDRGKALAFVKKLIAAVPATSIVACASPCFCSNGVGFVMPTRCYGVAKDQYIWDTQNAPPSFGAIRGDLRDYSRHVLGACLNSPYLTLAVLGPLASSLLGCVKAKGGGKLIPETAMFHFGGGSSTGKTTLGLIAQSVFGEPKIDVDYEGTDRGIAERAYHRNNLTLVVDEAELAGLGRRGNREEDDEDSAPDHPRPRQGDFREGGSCRAIVHPLRHQHGPLYRSRSCGQGETSASRRPSPNIRH
jgi:hypothetical protein